MFIGRTLFKAFWTSDERFYIATDAGIFELPTLVSTESSPIPLGRIEGIPARGLAIDQIRRDPEGRLFFGFCDGSVLVFGLEWDPFSEISEWEFDFQTPTEASEWTSELLDYERLF